MDFDQIQAFLKIVEEKSFSRAADRLYPPAAEAAQ